MTWQELFDELSTTQTNAFRDGDIARTAATIAGMKYSYVTTQDTSEAPVTAQRFRSPSSRTFARRWRSGSREGANSCSDATQLRNFGHQCLST